MKRTILLLTLGFLLGCLVCVFILPHRFEILVSGPSNLIVTKIDRLTGTSWISMAGRPWVKIGNQMTVATAVSPDPYAGIATVEKAPVGPKPWEEYQKQEEQQRLLAQQKLDKWKQLKQGMSKAEVEVLLGKPTEIHAYPTLGDRWNYPQVKGSYKIPSVEFTPIGEVKGWRMPID